MLQFWQKIKLGPLAFLFEKILCTAAKRKILRHFWGFEERD